MNPKLKQFLPHLVAPIVFIVAAYVYFSPLLEGKGLAQHDIEQWRGSAKELVDYREATGEQSLWTNSMFGGMPSYLISTVFEGNLLRYVDKFLGFAQHPASLIFITLLGFYVLLLVLGVNPWLAIVGAFAYGLSSYFFIIITAGHNAKIHAIAYVAPMIAGLVLAYRGKILGGLALFALFLGLNLNAGHVQITYYAGFVMVALFFAYLYKAIKENLMPQFAKASIALGIAAILAVGANFSRLYFTYDYGKDSIRGPSELTADAHNKTSGLDKDYATAWSYGVGETFNLLVPNLYGGSSMSDLGTESHTYNFLMQNNVPPSQARAIVQQMPAYWGPQPMTSGPVYIGAIVVFLFIFGLMFVKGPEKWAILIVTLIGIALAWGKNMMWFTDLFLHYFPGYNKFRTVSMILYIAELTMPLLAFIALKRVFDGDFSKADFRKAFFWALGITGGICLFLLLFGGSAMSFSAEVDAQYIAAGWPRELFDAVAADRAALMKADALRSLMYILLGGGVVFAFVEKKLKPMVFIGALGFLIIADMWVINRRYLNNEHFVDVSRVEKPFPKTAADEQILTDKSLNYRVFNLTVSPFNDASTSYYHKSIGGYHGAKLRRYQDVIDLHISRGNMKVLNMLNTKYFIEQGQAGPVAKLNTEAMGNAWFVDSVSIQPNADAEVDALGEFNPATTALVDKRFESFIADFTPAADSSASIQLVEYYPNRLVYSSKSSVNQLAVFSEIYYDKGWKAYIDGVEAPHFRANYILRAMAIPAGEHKVKFEFKPAMFAVGKAVDLASSLLIILLFVGWAGFGAYKEFVAKK